MLGIVKNGPRERKLWLVAKANDAPIKAARERKKLKLAPASGADCTNHEEHSNKIVGAKKSSLEKSMPMLV